MTNISDLVDKNLDYHNYVQWHQQKYAQINKKRWKISAGKFKPLKKKQIKLLKMKSTLFEAKIHKIGFTAEWRWQRKKLVNLKINE